MPIQGYVDETGNDGRSPFFLFSALIAPAEMWAWFADRWEACLKASPSIQYFKMDEAESRTKQFRGFSVPERDAKLRQLCQILGQISPVEVSSAIDLVGFANTWGKTERPFSEPYFFPFLMANVSVAFHVAAMEIGEKYEIFFDEHRIFGPRAKAWYPVMVALQTQKIQEVMPVEPFFRTDIDALPLQGADITAWIARKVKTTGLGELEWIKQELNGVLYSPISKIVDERWIRGLDEPLDEEYEGQFSERFREVLRVYRETFGHEFPPKNKLERKRMRGRK